MKIEGRPDLERRNGAVINTNTAAWERAAKKKKLDEIRETEFNTLKNEVTEIKQILKEIRDGRS